MPGWLLVILLVFAVAALGFGALTFLSFLVVRRSKHDPFVAGASYAGLANCLGTDGLDRTLRGTGTLAVFPEEVRFVIATPRRQITVPRRRLAVTLEQFPDPGDYRPGDKPALVLRWSDRGKRQAIGFQVPDPDEWRSRLLA